MEIKKKIFSNSKVKLIFRLLFSFSVLMYLFYYLDSKNIISVFKNIELKWFLIALFLLIPNLFFSLLRWGILSKYFFSGVEVKEIVKSYFVGSAGRIISPFQIGEYVGRGVVLNRFSKASVVTATLIDKYVPLFIVLLAGFLIGSDTLAKSNLALNINFTIVRIIGSLLVATVIMLYFLRKKLYHSFLQKRNTKFLHSNKELLKVVAFMPSTLFLSIILISVVHIIIYLSQFSLLIIAFEYGIEFFVGFKLVLLVMFLKSLLPFISISELGVREGLTVLVCSMLGVSEVAGFNAAILLFLINLILPSLIGIPYAFSMGGKK